MDTDSGIPGEVPQRSTVGSPSSFCSRNFWKGAHLELLEVPSGPGWKGGRGLGPNRVGGGDQTPDHSACEEAHPEEARRLITTFPPLSLPTPPTFHGQPKQTQMVLLRERPWLSFIHSYLTYSIIPVGGKF